MWILKGFLCDFFSNFSHNKIKKCISPQFSLNKSLIIIFSFINHLIPKLSTNAQMSFYFYRYLGLFGTLRRNSTVVEITLIRLLIICLNCSLMLTHLFVFNQK